MGPASQAVNVLPKEELPVETVLLGELKASIANNQIASNFEIKT